MVAVVTEDKIEAAAKALYFEVWKRMLAVCSHRPECRGYTIDQVWNNTAPSQRELCRNQARAAIAAFGIPVARPKPAAILE